MWRWSWSWSYIKCSFMTSYSTSGEESSPLTAGTWLSSSAEETAGLYTNWRSRVDLHEVRGGASRRKRPTSETCTGLQSCCCQAPSCLQPSLCGLDPTSNVQRRESSFGGVERCSWTESSGQPWGVRGANAQAPFLSVIGFRINWDLDSVACCDLQTYSLKAGTETPNTAETSPPAAERHTPSKCHVKSCSSDWVCR